MTDRTDLAGALARLSPPDRELLEHSFRRRVPDEQVAAIIGVAPDELDRMRAAAVDRLGEDLAIRRGPELGDLLKQLLEPATWEIVGAAAETRPKEPGSDQPVHGSSGFGMLTEDHETPGDVPTSDGGGRGLALGVAAAIAVLVPVGVVAALALGGDEAGGTGPASEPLTRPFAPEPQAVSDPFPSYPKGANRYPVAYVRGSRVLYDRPGGKRRVRIGRRTSFGTRRYLGVAERRGAWLAVLVPELKNGELGWIHSRRVTRLHTVTWSVHADLSQRRIVVRRGGKRVRSARIGVGRSGHATPTGRFAVTDKLSVNDPSSPYGCCVLALSGHQTKLPRGWPGGDRLAIHATADLSGLGRAVSLGCMRSDPRDARWMMKRVPVGSPVFIRE